MRAKEKKRNAWFKLVLSKLSVIILFAILIVVVQGTWSVYKKARFANENRQQAEAQSQELAERTEALTVELDRLQTDRGREEVLRQQFDVGHEGEHLIVLVDAPHQEVPPAPKQPTLWERFKSFFSL